MREIDYASLHPYIPKGRVKRQRLAFNCPTGKILHVFQNLPRGNHLSAEELYKLLEKRKQGISLSTFIAALN